MKFISEKEEFKDFFNETIDVLLKSWLSLMDSSLVV